MGGLQKLQWKIELSDSTGGTKSEVGGLISQFQEFAKVSSKQSGQSRTICFALLFAADCLGLAVLGDFNSASH